MAILSVRNKDGTWTEIPAIVPGSDFVESEEYRGCYYHMVNGEKEWVNPPMNIGIEYRTTERWKGKPVYAKAYDFGALPNANRRTANHNIANMDACLASYGVTYAESDPYGYYFPTYNNTTGVGQIGIYVNKANTTVTTTVDWSEYNAIIVLKYTKTTD